MDGLTTMQVKHAKPGRHHDGNGLYLHVRSSGSRAWVFRATVDGKLKDYGLGSVAKVSLSQARIKARSYREKLNFGEAIPRAANSSPLDVRPEASASAVVPSFAEAARACHTALKAGWKNKRHSDSWLSSLEIHIFKHFGDERVDTISSSKVRSALAPIWLKVPETARRVFQRIKTVLDFAHIEGWCPNEVSLRSVPRGLPRQPVDDNHFEAMPYADVPAFMKRLAGARASAGRDALMFTILNAARSGETRLANWTEIDLEAATWTIPAARMKMNKVHVVPLTEPALVILRRRWNLRISDTGLVFSTHGKIPLSDMTMSKVMRALEIPKITVHGFRSSFTDWAAENTEVPKEVVDKALAHKLADRIEAAYRRTDFFDRRRQLMASWAAYVTAS
jgi:integrase